MGKGAHGMRQLAEDKPPLERIEYTTSFLTRKILSVAEDGESLATSEFLHLLKTRAVNNQIVLTVASSSFKDLTLNQLCSFKRIKLTNYVIGALDERIYMRLKRKGYPVFLAFQDKAAGGYEVESVQKPMEKLHGAGFVKEKIIAKALAEGYEVVMSDADVVWNKNPMKNFAEHYRDFDFAFQDAVSDEALDNHLSEGLFYVKPTDAGKEAMEIILRRLDENPSRSGEAEFQDLLCSNSKRKSSTKCYDHVSGAKTILLPKRKYAKTWFMSKFQNRADNLSQMSPYTVYYNGGPLLLKKVIMVKHGLWHLDKNNRCSL